MDCFKQNVYAIASKILNCTEIEFIKTEIAKTIKTNSSYNIRHLDKKVSAIKNLANNAKNHLASLSL